MGALGARRRLHRVPRRGRDVLDPARRRAGRPRAEPRRLPRGDGTVHLLAHPVPVGPRRRGAGATRRGGRGAHRHGRRRRHRRDEPARAPSAVDRPARAGRDRRPAQRHVVGGGGGGAPSALRDVEPRRAGGAAGDPRRPAPLDHRVDGRRGAVRRIGPVDRDRADAVPRCRGIGDLGRRGADHRPAHRPRRRRDRRADTAAARGIRVARDPGGASPRAPGPRPARPRGRRPRALAHDRRRRSAR